MGSIAFSVGLQIVSYLLQPKPKTPTQYGPRLGDLKVQTADYGNPIPRVYGTMRVAGNVIWATNLKETKHTNRQRSGGKGGGSKKTTTVTYTYSQSFAVALCEGPIFCIRKIWANGSLIYNVSETTNATSIVASNIAVAGIRVYLGTEDQQPDGLIQTHLGIANVPAYRGTAYVVFEDLQLEKYGNRTPNVEFEVVTVGQTKNALVPLSTQALGTSQAQAMAMYGDYIYITDASTGNLSVYNVAGYAYDAAPAFSYSYDEGWGYSNINTLTTRFVSQNVTCLKALVNTVFATDTTGNITVIDVTDPNNPNVLSTTFAHANLTYIDIDTNVGAVVGNSNLITKIVYQYGTLNIYSSASTATAPKAVKVVGSYAYVISQSNFEIFSLATNTPTLVSSIPLETTTELYVEGNYVYTCGTNLTIIDIADKNNPAIIGSIALGQSGANSIDKYSTYVSIGGSAGWIQLYNVANVASPVLAAPTLTTSEGILKVRASRVKPGLAYALTTTNQLKAYLVSLVYEATAPTLGSIVTNIATLVNLKATDLDVSQIESQAVHGYVLQRGTIRSYLEPLMQVFHFDAVESDDKIKFVKRGNAVVADIPEDDIAAHEQGQTMPDNMINNRQQEVELPAKVSIQYIDPTIAYSTNSQSTAKYSTDSAHNISLNMPIAMTAEQARNTVEVIMQDAWAGRTTFEFDTGYRYSFLDPTDIVRITKNNNTYTIRITEENFTPGLYKRKGVLEDVSIYEQSIAPAYSMIETEYIQGIPVSDLLYLDIPLLKDLDDGKGFYSVASGMSSGWYGTQAYKSIDNGSTWSAYGPANINDAVMGTCATTLGNYDGKHTFDELNTLVVILNFGGTLEGDSEINVLNGSNLALVGNEIIHFKNAVLIDTGVYQLSGFLRGLKGTEQHIPTHTSQENFVLLDIDTPTVYVNTAPSEEYGIQRMYKGVSLGGYVDDAIPFTFTHSAVSLKPLSPVYIGGGRNSVGDVIITWIRRGRISAEWNNNSDIPLGEYSELYEVDVYTDANYTTIKRTITGITTNTCTYSTSMQADDFGSLQSLIYFKVYQISNIIGRGFAGKGSI